MVYVYQVKSAPKIQSRLCAFSLTLSWSEKRHTGNKKERGEKRFCQDTQMWDKTNIIAGCLFGEMWEINWGGIFTS